MGPAPWMPVRRQATRHIERTTAIPEEARVSDQSRMAAVAVTRRKALIIGAGALAAASVPGSPALADEEIHGISAFGDLKYPANFKQLDYVDPNAPKGGLFSHVGSTRAYNQNFLTFNSLNSFILKGDAAQGMQLTF